MTNRPETEEKDEETPNLKSRDPHQACGAKLSFGDCFYIIKGSLEVLTSDYTILKVAGSSCSIDVLTAEMFWLVGIARNALFFHSFVASKARKGRSEKRELRRIGCPRCRQNLHHACARERFGSQNR